MGFECVLYSQAAGVRYKAGECLSLLSSCYMQPIIILYVEKMAHVKREADERAYTLFQNVCPHQTCNGMVVRGNLFYHVSCGQFRRPLLCILISATI
jgi:hypothetical protein